MARDYSVLETTPEDQTPPLRDILLRLQRRFVVITDSKRIPSLPDEENEVVTQILIGEEYKFSNRNLTVPEKRWLTSIHITTITQGLDQLKCMYEVEQTEPFNPNTNEHKVISTKED